jgi:hypothetical protein
MLGLFKITAMRRISKNQFGAVAMGLLLSALILPMLPAHAYTVPNTASIGWTSALSNLLAVTVANVGDMILVNVQLTDGSNAGKTTISVTGVTDTAGDNFTQSAVLHVDIAPNCSAGNCFDSEIWSAVAKASGSVTVTVSQSQSSSSGSEFQLLDVAGLPGHAVVDSATGTGTSGVFGTSTSPVIEAGNIPDASIWTACTAAFTSSAGTGFTKVGDISPFVGWSEYGSSSPVSPTSFPGGCTGSTRYLDVGVIFGLAPPVSIVVVACTAYQLQCWLYPLFTMGVYMVLVVGIARIGKVPSRDMVGHILEAFALGSLVAVMFGIINVMFPVLITVFQVIRAVRE